MEWKIIADSTADLSVITKDQQGDTGLASVPFSLILDGQEYVDDASLNVGDFVQRFYQSAASSSACPSPEAFYKACLDADKCLIFTISSALSGSYASAMSAKQMLAEEHPEKQVCVIDSKSAAGPLVLAIEQTLSLIAQNLPFGEVCQGAQKAMAKTEILFIQASFQNFIRNGRMSRMMGILAAALGMRGVAYATAEGAIGLLAKVRGEAKAIALLCDEMGKRKPGFQKVHITQCENPEGASKLKACIEEKYPGAAVEIRPAAGLNAYYAERGGLLVGFY